MPCTAVLVFFCFLFRQQALSCLLPHLCEKQGQEEPFTQTGWPTSVTESCGL